MNKLASIETITEILPHPNADRLALAKVLGWQVVVRKDEFKAGDIIVLVSIDTILPDAPWSEFLKDKNHPERPIRLKTVRLRGQYSQGLCLPCSVLPTDRPWRVGSDVACELGIKKYEKEIPLALSGEVAGKFPEWIVAKTDEDNGLSHPETVTETLRFPCDATLKLDGSSGTVVIQAGRITEVCSRNLSLKDTPGNAFWHAARKMDLNADGRNMIIQGELMGPGIQGNQLQLTEPTLFVFQIKTEYRWLTYAEMAEVALKLKLPVVPYVAAVNNGTGGNSLDALQALADHQKLPDGSPAEGIVIRPVARVNSGIGRPLGFKILNRSYAEN